MPMHSDDTGDEGRDRWKDLNERGFARPCTWRPGRPCWLRDDVHLWNFVFQKAGLELKEHVWSQMMIERIRTDDPFEEDILRGALLMHFLLRRHSCVTRVDCWFEDAKVEYKLFWDALKSAASSLTHFYYQVATRYQVDHPTEPEVAANFLEKIAKNKTLKTFRVSAEMMHVKRGKSLSIFVRHHTVIEELEVDGGSIYPASGVLRAAVVSKSLKVLRVHNCHVASVDIWKMSAALNSSLLPTPSPQSADFDTPMLGVDYHVKETTPISHLETLEFFKCHGVDHNVKESFASLIGGKHSICSMTLHCSPTAHLSPGVGVLLSLTLKDCFLTDKFAVAAAKRLRSDVRLRLLDVTANEITVSGLTAMINALGAHRSPETFAFSVRPTPTPNAEDETSFLEALRNHGASSRLRVFWSNPPASYFPAGINLCALSVVSISLECCKDRLLMLGPVATSNTISTARFTSDVALGEQVTGELVEVIRRNRYIRSLDLSVCVTAHEGLSLLRALKGTTVEELELSDFIFDESCTNALCAVVSANPCINKLVITVAHTFNQEREAHRVCRALVEALKENYVLASLVVRSEKRNSANDFDLGKLMRRNMMQVHEAVQFVMGSDERRHALAFDVQKDSRVLRETVSSIYNLTEEVARSKIAEARCRLSLNYLYYTGIVSRLDDRPALGRLGINVLARVFGLASVRRVLDAM
ncbi:hypothetical protein HPB50_015161 [Hyalomma asiaticum]|uniref:Uncharacterized protein n=1 Tax=Hyalomma asiaticum TaxID=266040 RepID=A0ACB7RIT9_HYAAI|nr:hypothetical protein HPB50_015161 [Hyalomma asiaticum]